MIQMIESQVKGGDDFKRTFITFFMSIYMFAWEPKRGNKLPNT